MSGESRVSCSFSPIFVQFAADAVEDVLARLVVVECKHFGQFGSGAPFGVGAVDVVDGIGVETVCRFQGNVFVESDDVGICVVDEYEVTDRFHDESFLTMNLQYVEIVN